MSGGRWNYGHDRLFEAARNIEKIAARNPYGDGPETLAEFMTAAAIMRRAALYWKRIDWLVSADDSEESFHRRLKEDLNALENGVYDDHFEN